MVRPPESKSLLQLNLLGHLDVSGPDGAPLASLRPRAQRLLVFLLLHRHSAVSREQIGFTLFPDLTEPNALATLRRALNDVRAALSSLAQVEWILSDGGTLCWNTTTPFTLDIQEFERLVQAGTPASLHQAIRLYRGDLARELDDEWLLGERERFRQLQLDALQKLAVHHRALGEYAAALDLARQLLLLDPFAEAAHREVIALHYEMGDRAAALAQYERLRSRLRNELDVEPMDETQALVAAITQGASLSTKGAAPPARKRSSRSAHVPFGRDAELAELYRLWERTAAGHGGFVFINGEAGVGKSHLASGLADDVTTQGALALTGHCYSFEQALPYQPILEMLRAAANLLQHVQLHPTHRAAVARLAPDVLGAMGSPGEQEASPGELRARLFEGLTQSFFALARAQPLLLIVEDAHWAAESTLDWLTYLAPSVGSSRLMVLLTHRSGEVEFDHALAEIEERLRRTSALSALALKPLDREATHALVIQLSGLTQAHAEKIADRLYDQTGGNPFFVQELARGMIEAGQIRVQEGKWTGALLEDAEAARLALPNSLRATINARVERLTEMACALLRTAAVAGRVFDHTIVQHAGEWSDELVLAALEELLARNFIREGGAPGQFYFAHHLVQDAIYSDMTAPRRSYLHRRLAGALDRRASDDFEALAFHRLRAGDPLNAVQALAQGAKRAMGVYAYADALRALEQASEVLDKWQAAGNLDRSLAEQQIQILLDRAAILPHVGRSAQEHEQTVLAAGKLLTEYPNRRLQVQYYLQYSELLSNMALYEPAAETALKAHNASLELGYLRGAAQGLYLAGINKSTLSQNHAARRLLEQALELYRQPGLGDDYEPSGWLGIAASESMCLSGLGIVGFNLGEISYGLSHLKRALELSEKQGDKPGIARACYLIAVCWTYNYNAERIETYAQRAVDLYREMGLALLSYRPMLLLGSVQCLRLQFAEALETYKQCFTEAHHKQDRWLEGWAGQYMGRLALDMQDMAQAEYYLIHTYELRRESGEAQNQVSDLTWLARLRLAQGNAQAALEHTQDAVTRADALSGDFYVWERPDVFFAHAEALIANGNASAAAPFVERAYDELLLFAKQIDEAQVRQTYFAYPPNMRIVAAWRQFFLPHDTS